MTKRRNKPTVHSDVQTLLEMLTWCRPHGSRADREFATRYVAPTGAVQDAYGNWQYQQGNGRILWSCHTDTVHRVSGRQRVEYHAASGLAMLPEHSPSNCLGADDTIGVWMLGELIRAGVPGHYTWHYGEESGGIGSRAAVRAGQVPDVDAVIAFDRAGYGDVVTHQWGGRTCSDAAAWQIAGLLTDAGLKYVPRAGVYTDSAEYADVIRECTNLSVGYQGQHTKHETADLEFARRLRDVVCGLDWGRLVPEREPGDTGYVTVVDDWGLGGQWTTQAEAVIYEEEEEEELCPVCGDDWGLGRRCGTCGSDIDDLPWWHREGQGRVV